MGFYRELLIACSLQQAMEEGLGEHIRAVLDGAADRVIRFFNSGHREVLSLDRYITLGLTTETPARHLDDGSFAVLLTADTVDLFAGLLHGAAP